MSSIEKNDFLELQLEVINNIAEGNSTWDDLNDLRADYYGEREHRDTTSKGSKLLKEYIESGWIKKPIVSTTDSKKTVLINSDGSQSHEGKYVIDDEDQLKDTDFLLTLHNYDPDQWEVISSRNSLWEVQTKENGIKKLYSSRIIVKPKKVEFTFENIKDMLEEVISSDETIDYEHTQYEEGSNCLIPALFDIHFAKLCYNAETGNNYDYKIARDRLLRSADEYIERSKDFKFEKIILPIGNDYFNSEFNGSTTGLTPQDNDSRYSKMFIKGVEALLQVIEKFKILAPVDVLLVQGNHDFFISFAAAYAIKLKYDNDPDVFVDSNPTTRKYELFGVNLFGFTHGSEEKDRLFSLMQSEVPELWGRSKNRDWFTGHFHKLAVEEKGGVTKWTIPSLCGKDAWHYKMGFTEAIERTMCFVYDKEKGLVDIMFVNV